MTARSILVERAGLQSLIVDRGRFGYRDRGVAWCGAADALAFTLAQRLAGNNADDAALEIVMGDVAIRFGSATRCALAGADCDARVDGVRVPAWGAFDVSEGAQLTLERPRTWTRTVVAFGGGIDVAPVLGSRTTDVTSHLGGVDGRALRAGDRLALGTGGMTAGLPRVAIKPPHADFAAAAFGDDALFVRVIAEPGCEPLWGRTWTVGHESNRMGCRLRGEPLTHDLGSIPSRAVFPGVVQLPPGGEPIVLLSDAQTTGGYPVAGTVIEADLWILGQARAGSRVRLIPCTLDDAQAASDRVASYVAAVNAAIEQRVRA